MKFVVLDAELENGDLQQALVDVREFGEKGNPEDYFVRPANAAKLGEVEIVDNANVVAYTCYTSE